MKKVKLTKDFAWCHDGMNPTVIPAGTEVESPIAENALQMGCAEVVKEEPQEPPAKELAKVEEKAAEPPKNKAAPAPSNKAAAPPKKK